MPEWLFKISYSSLRNLAPEGFAVTKDRGLQTKYHPKLALDCYCCRGAYMPVKSRFLTSKDLGESIFISPPGLFSHLSSGPL